MSTEAMRRLSPLPEREDAGLVCRVSTEDGLELGEVTLRIPGRTLPPVEEREHLLRAASGLLLEAAGGSGGAAALGRPGRGGWWRLRPGAMLHAVLEHGGETIGECRLPAPVDPSSSIPPDLPLGERIAVYEKALIEEALRATRGNRARAARLLRTTERILGYRIQQYEIDPSRFRPPR